MYEAIILAGGFGTRLKGVIGDIPKPMAPVANRPFLAYLLDMLDKKKFEKVIISLGYKAQEIIDFFGSKYKDLQLEYVIESKPLGTGGAIRLALLKVKKDHCYIFNGDSYLDFDIKAAELLWGKNNFPVVIGVEVEDTSRFGRILSNKGYVKEFKEKKTSGTGVINAGIYILKKTQLNSYTLNSSFSFESDYLLNAVKNEKFNILISKGTFIDIGIPEDYRLAQDIIPKLNT